MEPSSLARMRRKVGEAQGYLELEMPERALEILSERTDWSTFKFHALLIEGDALRALGRHREALAPLAVAAAMRPGDVRVAIIQGWCYKRTHRLAQAIDALKAALRKHPQEAILHYNLACYWSLLGDADKALAALTTALVLDSDYRDMLSTEADFDPIRSHPDFERLASSPARSG